MESFDFDFVNRANAEYIDGLYEQYKKDPRSIPEQWRAFFAGFEVGIQRTEGDRPSLPTAPLSMGIYDLVHSYRELGHFVAKLDPLGHDRPHHPLLELTNFGMTVADLDRQVGTGGFTGETDGTLRDLIEKLRTTYTQSLGVEFIGISDKTQRDWLIARMEPIYDGQNVKVSLLPNPSHLELINPIMQGIVRAKQAIFGDKGRGRVVPICVHGDAAFTGQGVVPETLSLSELHGFATGGTIHIIVNNQIGFTTPPKQERFTPYPTDMAKAIQAPIFHVNGDDPEACVWAAQLAIAFRQQFKVDVMIDLWCYRRNGHNETDEPSFTQPVMYREIEQLPTTRQIYAKRILERGLITEQELEDMKKTVIERLNVARDLAKEVKPRMKTPGFSGIWRGLGRAPGDPSNWSADTRVSRDVLDKVSASIQNIPP